MPVNVQSFHCTYNMVAYIHGSVPLAFPLPLLATLCLPFVSPFTYLAPSSCDRDRPPRSQVACKLTPFAPPFTQLSHPFQIPKTPTVRRQDDLGNIPALAIRNNKFSCNLRSKSARSTLTSPGPIRVNMGIEIPWIQFQYQD